MIEVVEYDPAWPLLFLRLRDAYASAMTEAEVPVVAIEHVGSTAVPGLAGKPVIDVDIVVTRDHVEPASVVLETLGFRRLGELGIPQRWAFKEPARLPRTNTYVIVEDSLALQNHLRFRDTLRGDPALRDEYARVKRAVGGSAADIAEYGQGKNAMVQQVLARAGFSQEERDRIASHQVPGPEVPR